LNFDQKLLIMRSITLVFLVLYFSNTISAQKSPVSFTISGRITSVDENLLAGTSVQVINSVQGVSSGDDGTYIIVVSQPGEYILRFSNLGFKPLQVKVKVEGTQTTQNIVLHPTLVQLNDQLVITAQRYETNYFERPEAVTLVSSRDLSQNALRSTPEILSGQSGVFVQKTNHGGGSPFVRGLTGQQTLLLVDGIRLNNATFRSGPNQYLNTLDPFLVDRIEVARGNGSVSYGSDAIGGAISILTKSPDFTDRKTFKGSVVTKWASGGMEKSGRLALGVSSQKVAVQGGISYRSFGDLIGGQGIGKQTPTGYDQLSFDVKSLIQLRSDLRLTVAVQHLQQDSVPVYHKVKLEDYALNQFDPQTRTLIYARLEGYKNTRAVKSWQITPLWSRTEEGRQSQKNGAIKTLTETDKVKTTGLLASVLSEPTRFWTIQSGVEWYFDRVSSRKQDRFPIWSSQYAKEVRGLYPDNAEMSNLAFYTLHTLNLKKLIVTAGGRFNSFVISIPDQDLGTTTLKPSAWVGNAGASYPLLPSLRLVGNVNTSFRAPNIDDLGTLGIVDFRYEVPNNNLRPESGFNKEVGLKLKVDRFSTSVFVYHNQLTDLITRVKTNEIRDGYPVYLKENSAKAFIKGLEMDSEWQLTSKLLLRGYFNYTNGQNVTANEPYRRIPPMTGKVALWYQPTNPLWINLEGISATKQDRLSNGDKSDNRIPMGGTPGWNIVNLSTGYTIGKVKLSGILQNIFNEAYRTHGSGVDGVGRSLWFTARFDW